MRPKSSMLIFVIAIVALVIVSGCADKKEQQQSPAAGMYAYKLAEKDIGDGWQLVQEYKNLADWPLEQQKTFAVDGIADAAGWKYSRGNESLYVWARNFTTTDDLVRVETEKVQIDPYKGSFYWGDVSELPQYGDLGRIGVFGNPNDKASRILFLYIAQEKTMVFIQYANTIADGREMYDKTKLFDDKRFLIRIGKGIFAKL